MNNKLKYLVVALVVILAIPYSAFSQGSVSIFVSGNLLFPSDENYKQIYGGSKFLPEVKIGMNVMKGMSTWVGFGYLKASGRTLILDEAADSSQIYLSGGIGYRVSFADKLGMSFRAGLLYALLKETAMEETVSASGIGFVVGAGPYFDFSKNFSIEIEAGYAGASTTVEDVAIKIGGFKAGLGLSISF